MVDDINLGSEKEYNPAEVFVDLETSDADNFRDYFQSMTSLTQPHIEPSFADHQVKAGVDEGDTLNKLYTLCIENKSTQVVRRDKSMTPITNKLEEVYADLWSPYNPSSQSGSSYTTILICEYTSKI